MPYYRSQGYGASPDRFKRDSCRWPKDEDDKPECEEEEEEEDMEWEDMREPKKEPKNKQETAICKLECPFKIVVKVVPCEHERCHKKCCDD